MTSTVDFKSGLTWFEEHNIGFYNVKHEDMPYDRAYFDNYRKSRDTEIGRLLNKARVELVEEWWDGSVVDFGIGDGAFITARGGNTYGCDINPAGIEWLKEQNALVEYYSKEHDAVTFWDSLEHVHDIKKLVRQVKYYAFISIPIFKNREHVLSSKHFKPNEHVWYFTKESLIEWMNVQGFVCLEYNEMETEIGREDIGSFVFRRKDL